MKSPLRNRVGVMKSPYSRRPDNCFAIIGCAAAGRKAAHSSRRPCHKKRMINPRLSFFFGFEKSLSVFGFQERAFTAFVIREIFLDAVFL